MKQKESNMTHDHAALRVHPPRKLALPREVRVQFRSAPCEDDQPDRIEDDTTAQIAERQDLAAVRIRVK